MSNHVGDLGQDEFKKWCTKAGLVASPPVPDKMGWDFFVEWESTSFDIPLDRQNELPKALVQVKASGSARPLPSVTAKLSALKKLVDTELPAFIVFIKYDKQSTVCEAHLLHIGDDEISKILERTRLSEKNQKPLNHVSLSLPLNSASEIDTDGENLADLLKQFVGDSMSAYAERKRKIVEKCGHGVGSSTVSVSFEGRLDDLVDEYIGIRKGLPILHGKIENRRFGISLPSDTHLLDGGTLHISPSPGMRCTAVVVDIADSTLAQTKLDVFAPPELLRPLSETKMVLSNDFIKIVCDFKEGRTQFEYMLSEDLKLPWQEMNEALGFMVALDKSEAEIRVDSEEGTLLRLQKGNEFFHPPVYKDLLEVLKTPNRAIDELPGFSPADISLGEILTCLDAHQEMFTRLTKHEPSFRFNMTKKHDGTPLPRTAICLTPLTIEFPCFIYCAIVKHASTSIDLSEEQCAIKFGPPMVVNERIHTGNSLDAVDWANGQKDLLAHIEGKKSQMVIATELEIE